MPVEPSLSMSKMVRFTPVLTIPKVVVLPKFRLGCALKICRPLMNRMVRLITQIQWVNTYENAVAEHQDLAGWSWCRRTEIRGLIGHACNLMFGSRSSVECRRRWPVVQ